MPRPWAALTSSGEKKDRTFVLDSVNQAAAIQASFEPYYKEARVESTTDPNIVHEIAAKLAQADTYTSDDVETFARCWFDQAGHNALSAAMQGPTDRFATLYDSAKARDDKSETERLTGLPNIGNRPAKQGNEGW